MIFSIFSLNRGLEESNGRRRYQAIYSVNE